MKKYKCKDCKKSYRYEGLLRNHIMKIHPPLNIPPKNQEITHAFSCICGRKYFTVTEILSVEIGEGVSSTTDLNKL